MDKPLVSIITPAFNAEKHFDETIKSVLAQSYRNFEYIIIDDFSSDNTIGTVQAFKDERIVLLKNKTNKGISFNRNLGVKSAKGKYIAFIDSDDLMTPNRIEKQVNFLEKNIDFGILGTEIIKIDEFGKQIGEVVKYKVPVEQIPVRMLFNNYIATSSTMIRKECFENIYFDERFIVAEDYRVWIQIIRNYKISHIHEPLTKYRIHSGSISENKKQLMLDTDLKILKIQLDEIGYDYNEKEIKLFFDIGKNLIDNYVNQFSFLTTCFTKLVNVNNKSKIFNSNDLINFLNMEWKELFVQQKSFNKALLKEIKLSPFFKLLSKTEQIKLSTKCIIGYGG